MLAHRRHDISDRAWVNIEKFLPGSNGNVGRPSANNRLFINAIFWILRTGSPWRDLPPYLGNWKNTYRRFCRWRDRGAWEKILEALIVAPDFEWLIIDEATVRFILMPRMPRAAMKAWAAQRGAKLEVTSFRGCA